MQIYSEVKNAKAQAKTSSEKILSDKVVRKLAGELKEFLQKHGKLVDGQPYEVRKSRWGTFLLAVFDKELFEKSKELKIVRVYGPYIASKDGERYFKTKSYFTPRRNEIWAESVEVK